MSTSDAIRREADYIKFGFLSANAKQAIEHFLDKNRLSEQDRAAIAKGKEFIQKIADGASFVRDGNVGRYTVMESMNALDLAMDPLKDLTKLQ